MINNQSLLAIAILCLASLVACGKLESNETVISGTDQSAGILPAAQDMINAGSTTETAEAILPVEKGLALAQKNNCLACHQLDAKLIGPAWREVAKKYKGVAGSEHALIIKVATGGGGVWGEMPMPAMAPAVKEEDIRTLVKFVLSLEK